MAGQKNLLGLHEAVVIALINIDKEMYKATFDEIADYIEKNQLFPIRKGNISLAKQIELRTIQSKGRYTYLFVRIDRETIGLCLKAKGKSK